MLDYMELLKSNISITIVTICKNKLHMDFLYDRFVTNVTGIVMLKKN